MKDVFKKFRFRKIILAIADMFMVAVSSLITNFMLNGLHFYKVTILPKEMFISISISMLCCVGCLIITGAYSKLWRYFKSTDYLSCIYGIILGISAAYFIVTIANVKVPWQYAVIHGCFSMLFICLFRLVFKHTFIEISDTESSSSPYKRTMIIGAGRAGATIIREIFGIRQLPDVKNTPYEPVCIVDDNAKKIGTTVEGIEVVGTTGEIQKFVTEKNIEQIIFAIPSCKEEERQRILDICSKTTIPVKVIPFISDIVFNDENNLVINQIHDIKVEDLLGREPIRFDNDDIKSFICGKVCLVTGGGGSIGSELVRQIAKYEPKKVIIVDIYENNAYEIQQELVMEYGDKLDLITLIASVRDYFRMNQIFEKYKPDLVFHAAAHKHVPLMEVSPMEAIKNNVIGTFNVATIAQFHKVGKFVMISTDKAVNPTNAMGASKRCCEMIMQYLSQQQDNSTEFVTTRFGNVLGSNGSVIPLFKKQIEDGKPVTVTHPDIIRYFMTIPEAVSLVLEAASFAKGGEVFVLDMGKPVRIVALAENLIRMYGKKPYEDVKIVFTGLRPGEKIKEELLMDEEGLKKTSNKLIFIGSQINIEPDRFIENLEELKEAAEKNNEAVAINALHKTVPTFTTPEEFNSKTVITSSDYKDYDSSEGENKEKQETAVTV
ncbi:MAG: polysaccharide biosynthesis protein [Ruminococcus sp.]|nr:polysaccharide biosynthesis protein [Ruminococcus sp.]